MRRDFNLACHFNYNQHWQIGLRGGTHDDSITHKLPYTGAHLVCQSDDEDAIDWLIPRGTPVMANRDGVVVGMRPHAGADGPNKSCAECGNFVVLKHNDDTYAEYRHLKYRSVRLELGQKIEAGQAIAESGSQLHFKVYRVIDGRSSQTIAVNFQTESGIQQLQEGAVYQPSS